MIPTVVTAPCTQGHLHGTWVVDAFDAIPPTEPTSHLLGDFFGFGMDIN